MHFANAFAWVVAHWGTIAAVAAFILANVVTAASAHPDVVPVRALHVLQFAAQLISIFAPRDSGSVLKMPFTLAPAPSSSIGSSADQLASRGFARLQLLVVLALASTIACASVFGSTIVADEQACAMAGLHDVEAAAATILVTGGANYEQQIFALAAKVGTDTAICAIQAAIADFEKQHAADGGTSSARALVSFQDNTEDAIARGYLVLGKLRATP